jgi:carbamoyl-phosphate synthase large subunit
VKESVFPFSKFPGADTVLGPEMKSTGEVMGIDNDLGMAFAKSQIAANQHFPLKGEVFISVKNKDKRQAVFVAKELVRMGFTLVATLGTAHALKAGGLKVRAINKVAEARPNILDAIHAGEVALIINTPAGKGPRSDDYEIRRAAVLRKVPWVTTLSGAMATVNGIASMKARPFTVKSIQEHHGLVK